ncbi:MAG: hypothetical protein IPO21_20600 [Bacteroidales bacterium]|nr:hypothetical protein [Bacteroidales bacterium]
MKKIVFSLIMLSFTLFLNAQNYDLQQVLRMLNTKTNLNDAQKVQVLSLSGKYYPQILELQNEKSSNEAKYIKAIVIKKQLDGDLKDILDKNQYSDYQKLCDEYEKNYLKSAKKD